MRILGTMVSNQREMRHELVSVRSTESGIMTSARPKEVAVGRRPGAVLLHQPPSKTSGSSIASALLAQAQIDEAGVFPEKGWSSEKHRKGPNLLTSGPGTYNPCPKRRIGVVG
jgi:hypothetical protein